MQMVGIVQEQDPDRARLFMQWHRMKWPILVEPLNLLDVPYVPITLAIDEAGIIRKIAPPLMLASASEKPEGLEKEFLSRLFEGPARVPEPTNAQPDFKSLRRAARDGSVEDLRAYANALIMWGEPQQLGRAIRAYRRALELEPNHGPTHFRLGVAYRKRYDSDFRRSGDFQKAVDSWSRALEIDPNNYIWRRRIQQYGPRLDKPYPFYDWVRTAREAIIARGESPERLWVEPGRAELAEPLRHLETTGLTEKEPDPKGQVIRDNQHFVKVETIAVP
ncbi:MAG: hypothetical protein ACE5JI_20975, partial [Acidobacteriota bacterium]